jgi:hypothetical protein
MYVISLTKSPSLSPLFTLTVNCKLCTINLLTITLKTNTPFLKLTYHKTKNE